MSNPPCHAGGTMKKENEPPNDPSEIPLLPLPPKKLRVALEPELEQVAGCWPAAKRFEMARKFHRWARQLRITGLILFRDSHPASRPALRFVAPRKARLN
jgi:hypothetical protein